MREQRKGVIKHDGKNESGRGEEQAASIGDYVFGVLVLPLNRGS